MDNKIFSFASIAGSFLSSVHPEATTTSDFNHKHCEMYLFITVQCEHVWKRAHSTFLYPAQGAPGRVFGAAERQAACHMPAAASDRQGSPPLCKCRTSLLPHFTICLPFPCTHSPLNSTLYIIQSHKLDCVGLAPGVN